MTNYHYCSAINEADFTKVHICAVFLLNMRAAACGQHLQYMNEVVIDRHTI